MEDDHGDLGSFLQQVDKIDALVRGIKEGDESAFKEADALLEAQERSRDAAAAAEGRIVAERTVINKGSAGSTSAQTPAPLAQAGNEGMGGGGEGGEGAAGQDAFLQSLKVDAEERAARRREGRKKAEELKDKGNAAFNAGKHEEAFELYSQALRESPDFLPLYTNRAQTLLKLGRHKQALEDCEWALRLDEKCTKALLRRGLAYQALGQYPEAIEAFTAARKTVLQPERATFDAHIEETKRLQAVREAEAKALEAARQIEAGQTSSCQAVASAEPPQEAQPLAPPTASLSEGDQQQLPTSDPVKMVERIVPMLTSSASALSPERAGELAALLTQHSLDLAVSKDLFRIRGGLSVLEALSDKLSASPRLASALLLLLHKACKENETNQRATVESPAARQALARLLASQHEGPVSNALFLLALLADTEYARKILTSDITVDFSEQCLLIIEGVAPVCSTFAGTTRVQAALLLAILAACPEFHKRYRPAFQTSLFPRLRKLLDASLVSKSRPVSEATHILSILLHLSADIMMRDVMAGREGTARLMQDSLALLAPLKEGKAEVSGALEALLALLANLGLQAEALKVLEDSALADTLVDLVAVANTLTLRLRTVGLLARICNSQALADRLVENGGVKRLLQLARQSKDGPTLENVSRALAKCARGSEKARGAMGSEKGISALVDLLDSQTPAVAGNAALCLAECARSPEVCEALSKTEVIAKLLQHAKKETSGLQENSAVAIARLAQGHSAHLAKLRQLNGLEVLHARMKK